MAIIQFIAPIFAGFYIIYKAIEALDKIDRVQKHGQKKQARVIRIREEKSSRRPDKYNHYEDINLYQPTTYTYFHTVVFNDKNGRKIEKEITFGTDKKPNRNPPFSIGIIYHIDENKNIEIILENSKRTNSKFYFLLTMGILVLSFSVYNYNGEIDLIIDILKNIFE